MSLARLEQKVEDIYGSAAAVSFVKEHGGWGAYVWDAKGHEILSVWVKSSKKTDAYEALEVRLARVEHGEE